MSTMSLMCTQVSYIHDIMHTNTLHTHTHTQTLGKLLYLEQIQIVDLLQLELMSSQNLTSTEQCTLEEGERVATLTMPTSLISIARYNDGSILYLQCINKYRF